MNLASLLSKIMQTTFIFSYAVWGLGREVFTKLRFGSCSKKFGRWSCRSSI